LRRQDVLGEGNVVDAMGHGDVLLGRHLF
jgi:hypothetical protein